MRWRRFWLRVVLAWVAMGAVTRTGQYLSRRSFWHDEGFLIFNLRARTPWQCFGPLVAAAPQVASPAFILITQAERHFLGEGELSLRLSSLLFSLLALALFARIAWKSVPEPGAAFCVMLFALSDRIIMHSAEVKPYTLDIFYTCLLLWMAMGNGEATLSARRFSWVAAVASLGVWCSYTSLIIFSGISLSFLTTMDRGRVRAWLNFLLINLPVGASLAVVYWLSIGPQRNAKLYTDWVKGLADWSHPASVPFWCIRNTYGLAEYSALRAGPVVLLFGIVGAVMLWRAGRVRWLVMLVCPIGLLLAAGMLHVYPYIGERVTVFVAPLICLLAGFGFQATISLRRGWLRVVGWALAAVVTAILLAWGGYCLVCPRTRAHVRPAIEYVRAHRHPGDAVWVCGGDTAVDYRCYEKDPDALTRLGVEAPPPPLPTGRFWLIFGPPGPRNRDRDPILQPVKARAHMLESFVIPGGAAYLFESRRTVEQ